jgi:hypothetical protein
MNAVADCCSDESSDAIDRHCAHHLSATQKAALSWHLRCASRRSYFAGELRFAAALREGEALRDELPSREVPSRSAAIRAPGALDLHRHRSHRVHRRCASVANRLISVPISDTMISWLIPGMVVNRSTASRKQAIDLPIKLGDADFKRVDLLHMQLEQETMVAFDPSTQSLAQRCR